MAITIAFYGEKVCEYKLVADALCDWLGYGQPDEEGYYAPPEESEQVDVLVSGWPEHAYAVAEIVAWTARADLPYTTVVKRTDGEPRKPEEGEEIQASRDVESYIASALNVAADQDSAALILMIGDEGPDEETERLLSLVHDGVDVLVLGDALLPLQAAAQAPVEAAANPEPRQVAGEPVSHVITASVENTDWPIGDLLDMIDEQGRWFYETAMAFAGTLMELAELAERQRGQIKKARERGWLGAAADLAVVDEAQSFEPEQAAAPPMLDVEPASTVLLPTPNKTRREWLDPSDQTWKPVGRGRPRKDVEIREVPAA